MDKMVRSYSGKRMTCRWPLISFYNIKGVNDVNAYIIRLPLNVEWDQKLNKRRNFIIQLAEELVEYEENVAVPTWV